MGTSSINPSGARRTLSLRKEFSRLAYCHWQHLCPLVIPPESRTARLPDVSIAAPRKGGPQKALRRTSIDHFQSSFQPAIRSFVPPSVIGQREGAM